MSEEERTIVCDLNIDTWTVAEADAYRKAVGVNAEYALGCIQQAVAAALDEARARFGASVDEPGWQPPDDWVPLAMLNLDPMHLAGFAYIAARRAQPDIDFATLVASLHVGDLVQSFYRELTSEVDAAPLPNREQRRAAKTGPRKATASRCATSTTGHSKT